MMSSKVKTQKIALNLFLVFTLIVSVFISVFMMGPGKSVVQAASVTPIFNPNYSELIGRSDLNYTGIITTGTQGMSVANGKFGGPVWETNGNTLSMQLNHTDCFMFNEASAVSKDHANSGGGALGRVHVGFGSGTVFDSATQTHLSLYDGKLSIAGTGVSVNVIANMNSNVIAMQITDNRGSPQPITVDLTMLRPASEVWGAHTSTSTLTTHTDNKTAILEQVFQEACDTGITANNFYCNTALAATVQGRTVSSVTSSTVGSRTSRRLNLPAQSGTFTVIIGGDSTLSISGGAKNNAIANAVNSPDYNTAYTSSSAWWSAFWAKSYIFFPSQLNFEQRRNYYMYLAAISNRGSHPSKYNGGIWCGEEDRRDWGSFYWNWNQDSLYHPFMEANHIELLDPMFAMREANYAASQTAASQMWGASGIFIGETTGILGWETVPTAVSDSMKTYYNFINGTRAQVFSDQTARRNTFLTPWNWNVFGTGNNEASYVTHTMMATQETAEYYWQKYQYTKDLNYLRDHGYAFIKGAAEFYRTYPGFRLENGKYHFYNTNLHEHIWAGKDVIDDLSMARGVFSAVVKAAQLLGVDSNMISTWTNCRDNIAPYPLRTDSGALWAGSTDSSMITKLATGSPAFAQGLTPYYLIRDLQGTESPIFKMVEKYDVLNLETKDQGLDGGNWAIAYNTYLHSPGYYNQVTNSVIDRNGSSRFHEDAAKFGAVNDMAHILNTQYGVFTTYGVYPNLLFDQLDYYSAEGYGTYSAALQLALNQSLAPTTDGNPVIRVFPAWPTAWDAKYKLLAKDGFLVSSSMKSGDIQYVEIESQLGGVCRIRNPWNTNVVLYRNGVQAETITSSQNALMSFNTVTGEDIVLVRPGTTPDMYRTSSLTEPRSAYSQIEAETYNSQSGIGTESCGEGGLDVCNIENGDYVVYNNVDFGGGATSFQGRVASANSGGNIEIRLDSTSGTLVGTCSVAGTGGWQTYVTNTCSVSGASGTHNLYLRFTGGSGYLLNVNWFKFTSGSASPTPTPTPTPTPVGSPTPTPSGTKYEAENATLSGGAVVATNHTGYSGTGFVGEYVTQGATTTFNVSVPSAGSYNVDMRYSAGNGARTVSVYVNGVDVKQTSLPATTNWDTWGNKTETLTLNAGSNTIAYKYDSGDSGWINIDYITISQSSSNKLEAENAALSGGAAVATDHTGYSGTGFVAGYWTQGATTTFNVSVLSAGSYNVDMRYSAGNGARTVSIYVNGVDVKQTSLSATTNWDTWGDKIETLTLNAGSNTIAYKYDSSDSGWTNIDYITF
jgi:hypothetical protein